MSFPKFPEFRRITSADENAYLHYYSQLNEPNSDLSFNNLLIWLDYYNDLEGCDLNNNLIIKFTNVLDNDSINYSLVGASYLESTITSMFEFLSLMQQADTPKLSYVTEQVTSTARWLKRTDIKIEEDVENNDYVYNVNDLARMEGKRYRNLRERVIKFQHNKNIHMKPLDCRNEDERKLIESTVTEWSRQEGALRNDPHGTEITTIRKYLHLAKVLPIHAYGLYIDTKLACIVIVHLPPHRGWMIGEHLKYDYNHPGAFGYAIHELALLAQSQGIRWLNAEQDLGIEGLRFIKTVLRPAKFLRSYTLSLEPEVRHQ